MPEPTDKDFYCLPVPHEMKAKLKTSLMDVAAFYGVLVVITEFPDDDDYGYLVVSARGDPEWVALYGESIRLAIDAGEEA